VKGYPVNLSAPKQLTFWIAVILAVLSVLTLLISSLVFFDAQAVVLALLAFIVLALGNLLEGF
jgi:threonine/homoserine/homoserine lactone efflux protein